MDMKNNLIPGNFTSPVCKCNSSFTIKIVNNQGILLITNSQHVLNHYLQGTILNTSYTNTSSLLSSRALYEVGTSIIPIVQIRKLKH